jgi:hypothetical protein
MLDTDLTYQGFHMGKLLISLLRALKQKGLLEEEALLDILWEAKDPAFPWSKQDIKELLNL